MVLFLLSSCFLLALLLGGSMFRACMELVAFVAGASSAMSFCTYRWELR